MTDEEGYSGWTNYETWATALWIDNDEGSHYFARDLTQAAIENAAETDRTPQGFLADELKAWHEETMPDLGASLWADLLNAAFGEVDWYEIAENYLSEQAEA